MRELAGAPRPGAPQLVFMGDVRSWQRNKCKLLSKAADAYLQNAVMTEHPLEDN